MAYLHSTSVLFFQLIIVITIFAAATRSHLALIIATLCWVLFTIFGSIFTAGLMLLQLVTIAISFKMASARFSRRKDAQASTTLVTSLATQPLQPTTLPSDDAEFRKTNGHFLGWFSLFVGLVTLAIIAGRWQPSVSTPPPAELLPVASAGTANSPHATRTATFNKLHKNSSMGAHAHAKLTLPNDREFSDCLKLETDAEVMECAKTAR